MGQYYDWRNTGAKLTVTHESMYTLAQCYYTLPPIEDTTYEFDEDTIYSDYAIKWIAESGMHCELHLMCDMEDFVHVSYNESLPMTNKHYRRLSCDHLRELGFHFDDYKGDAVMNDCTLLKARPFTLQLCDDDLKRLWNKAASAGLTAPQLLENFIADLIDGIRTNGSDERMYATSWFDRCGFSANHGDQSFLQYLTVFDQVEGFVTAWNILQDTTRDLADEQKEQMLKGDFRDEEAIAALKNVELPWLQECVMDFWDDYISCTRNCRADYEQQVKAVLDWYQMYQSAIESDQP